MERRNKMQSILSVLFGVILLGALLGGDDN